MSAPRPLSAKVVAAIERGGLPTTKDSVDRHGTGQSAHRLPSAAMTALGKGVPLEAIAIVRKECGVDLRTAKLLVDAEIVGNHPLQRKLWSAIGLRVFLVILTAMVLLIIAFFFVRPN